MVRSYKRKSQLAAWDTENLQEALMKIRSNTLSIRQAASTYVIPKTTLIRHLHGNLIRDGEEKHLGRTPVLSVEQERQFCAYIKLMQDRLFGLTTHDVRSLAYQYCVRNDIKHTFSNEKQLAGWDWLYGFLARNKDISLRIPEPTSFARAVGVNKPQVSKFFKNLGQIYDNEKFTADKVFNMDETGMSTVQRPQKVLAEKGKRNVGALTSAERGRHVTAVCSMSASGQHVPPMFIFPRKRMKSELMEGAPVGTIGRCSPSGYIDMDIFLDFLRHFVKSVKCSKESKVLLILDGHTSHTKSIDAISFARDNGVILLSLPPHCSHKLQPLDLAFFKPLNVYYSSECSKWLRSHPGHVITDFQMSHLITPAFAKAASIQTAVNGFRASGIWPYNPEVISEEDYAPAEVTDVPIPSGAQSDQPEKICTDIQEDEHPSTSEKHIVTVDSNKRDTAVAFSEIIPIPKVLAADKSKRKRRSTASEVLTSSPYQASLNKIQATIKIKAKPKPTKPKRKHAATATSKREATYDSDSEDEWPCLVCCEPYSNSKPGERWIQCMTCRLWAHFQCTGLDRRVKLYTCDNCDSDDEM